MRRRPLHGERFHLLVRPRGRGIEHANLRKYGSFARREIHALLLLWGQFRRCAADRCGTMRALLRKCTDAERLLHGRGMEKLAAGNRASAPATPAAASAGAVLGQPEVEPPRLHQPLARAAMARIPALSPAPLRRHHPAAARGLDPRL